MNGWSMGEGRDRPRRAPGSVPGSVGRLWSRRVPRSLRCRPGAAAVWLGRRILGLAGTWEARPGPESVGGRGQPDVRADAAASIPPRAEGDGRCVCCPKPVPVRPPQGRAVRRRRLWIGFRSRSWAGARRRPWLAPVAGRCRFQVSARVFGAWLARCRARGPRAAARHGTRDAVCGGPPLFPRVRGSPASVGASWGEGFIPRRGWSVDPASPVALGQIFAAYLLDRLRTVFQPATNDVSAGRPRACFFPRAGGLTATVDPIRSSAVEPVGAGSPWSGPASSGAEALRPACSRPGSPEQGDAERWMACRPARGSPDWGRCLRFRGEEVVQCLGRACPPRNGAGLGENRRSPCINAERGVGGRRGWVERSTVRSTRM